MDAFYVSVELLRHPELHGLPVVVGGTAGRGVVSAASYEARRYGVYSAMSSATARKLCPNAVFLPPDISHYIEVSRHLHTVFESFTPLVEQISVDEAFMDVSGATTLMGDAVSIAWQLRERVMVETKLSCSVGIAPNKFLAKLASEHPLPVQALWGVGPATLKKLESIGVRRVSDLAQLDESVVCAAVGDAHGRHLYALSHGKDNRPVEPERIAKSIGHEETFAHDLTTHEELRVELVRLCDAVARRTREAGVAAGTLMLKLKFSSFESVTRSVTPSMPLTTGPSMVAALEPLLATLDCSQGVRLIGVHAQKLSEEALRAPRLFDDGEGSLEDIEEQWQPASKAIDSIVDKFGAGTIGPASGMDRRKPGENPFGPVLED